MSLADHLFNINAPAPDEAKTASPSSSSSSAFHAKRGGGEWRSRSRNSRTQPPVAAAMKKEVHGDFTVVSSARKAGTGTGAGPVKAELRRRRSSNLNGSSAGDGAGALSESVDAVPPAFRGKGGSSLPPAAPKWSSLTAGDGASGVTTRSKRGANGTSPPRGTTTTTTTRSSTSSGSSGAEATSRAGDDRQTENHTSQDGAQEGKEGKDTRRRGERSSSGRRTLTSVGQDERPSLALPSTRVNEPVWSGWFRKQEGIPPNKTWQRRYGRIVKWQHEVSERLYD